jgi:hypothetical protein
MKASAVLTASLLLAGLLAAQNPPAPKNPPAAELPAAHTEHGPHAAANSHKQHMQAMKAEVEAMRAALAQMKANVASIKDASSKKQAQLDADLWERMVAHLEGMVNMMSGADQGDEAACCAGMMGDEEKNSCAAMKFGAKPDGMINHGCCSGMKQAEGGMGCCDGAMGSSGNASGEGQHQHHRAP